MRLQKIDILRGIAIILMVLFHLNYTLKYIFNIELLNFSETFWYIIGKFSAILFILISGFSFYLAEIKYKGKLFKKYIKMSFILGIIAYFITVFTLLYFPGQYIRFGILHFFAVSFLLMLVFSKFKYYNILFALIILIYGIFYIPIITKQNLFFLGFVYKGFKSADYYPILPYFGVMLLGYSLALFLKNKSKLSIFQLKGQHNIFSYLLEYFGKNSLIIYIIHQPIIFLSLYFITEYFQKN